MEENRLKPMAVGYDEKLFNTLYKEITPLKRKLAHQIDCRRFGVPYEDILSFFDIKFLFCFNKHHNEPPEKLKAYLINSLQRFRYRIMRAAYTQKYSQSIVSLEDSPELDISYDENDRDYYYEQLMVFMEENISPNALLILQIQLNPPPFIIERINIDKDKPLQKIPDSLLLEYLSLGSGDNAMRYLKKLKKEIKEAIHSAKLKFHN